MNTPKPIRICTEDITVSVLSPDLIEENEKRYFAYKDCVSATEEGAVWRKWQPTPIERVTMRELNEHPCSVRDGIVYWRPWKSCDNGETWECL
jgi:hypothetical protein